MPSPRRLRGSGVAMTINGRGEDFTLRSGRRRGDCLLVAARGKIYVPGRHKVVTKIDFLFVTHVKLPLAIKHDSEVMQAGPRLTDYIEDPYCSLEYCYSFRAVRITRFQFIDHYMFQI